MFKIYDGREHFYQWDLNRKLIVYDSTIKEVHFCNRTADCSLVCEVYKENDLTLVNVPNILLQHSFFINVYAFDGEFTRHSSRFEVKPRTKPTDYVYTETEVKNWEEIKADVEQLYKNFDNAVKEVNGQLETINNAIKEVNGIKYIREAVDITELDNGIYIIDGTNGGSVSTVAVESIPTYHGTGSFYDGIIFISDFLGNPTQKLITIISSDDGEYFPKIYSVVIDEGGLILDGYDDVFVTQRSLDKQIASLQSQIDELKK